MVLDDFLTDEYKVLKFLYDNQVTILDQKVVPLTQNEVCRKLNISRNKMYRLFYLLLQKKMIVKVSQGKYQLLDNGIVMVETVDKLDRKIKNNTDI